MKLVGLTVQLLTISIISLRRQQTHNRVTQNQHWFSSYDYIVVGSGAAGAIVANRLTEDKNINVLLLEAGGPQTLVTDIPGNANSLVGSQYDWNYRTVPQKTFTITDMPIARGKVIGGSTTINGMIYNRGNQRDYDNWVQKYGAIGWSFDEVLPYFKKSENNTDYAIVTQNPGFHGTNGPIGVSSDQNPDPILVLHQLSLNSYGIKTIDINGAKQLGTAVSQQTIRDGIRSGVGNEFIERNPRNNLHVLANSLVTKILFHRLKGKLIATGVQFVMNGKAYRVSASKEVIVSAGSINSPQLLMLSGIGPKEHLNQMGIPVIVDLPVGDNLQDHPAVSIFMIIKNESFVVEGPQMTVRQLYELYTNRSGPLSRNTFCSTFVNTKSNPNPEWPNGFTTTKVWFNNDLETSVAETPSQRDLWRDYFRPYLGQYFLFATPQLYKVKSYGSVRLQSTNPFDYPLIDPKYLSNPQDLRDLIDLIRFVLYYLQNSYITPLIAQFPKPIPGCSYCPNQPLYDCYSYIMCLIEKTGKTGYHPVGTCRMGAVDRPDVVVDPRLRVKHVLGLRVIDSSVMPELPNANTNAASLMIGEKGSDLVKADNRF